MKKSIFTITRYIDRDTNEVLCFSANENEYHCWFTCHLDEYISMGSQVTIENGLRVRTVKLRNVKWYSKNAIRHF